MHALGQGSLKLLVQERKSSGTCLENLEVWGCPYLTNERFLVAGMISPSRTRKGTFCQTDEVSEGQPHILCLCLLGITVHLYEDSGRYLRQPDLRFFKEDFIYSKEQ